MYKSKAEIYRIRLTKPFLLDWDKLGQSIVFQLFSK